MYNEIPAQRPHTPLLNRIDAPSQLKALTLPELLQLADETRHYLLYAVGQSGGHFGANLGVVELTIALHYILNTPHDRLVWDVGHQAYAHKMLTGRREQLPTIRSKSGLTAFPAREESPYDTFGVGHSSTSISAALGMERALHYLGDKRKVACVIGDGAMTAGMAFEAMNDAVHHHADLLVVLNDNDMSISCSIGGFSRHLAALWYNGFRVGVSETGHPMLQPRPDMAHKPRIDALPSTDNLFKAIGFEYFGPFDGHDLPELIRILQLVNQRTGPRLVHLYTKKGKGFEPAEADPIGFHAIGPRFKSKPALEPVINTPKPQKYSDVFGQFLCDLAAQDFNMLAITPAMCEGSGMVQFAQRYPQRFFDVAIAEQHALTLAAGMACEGIKPVVAIYSTFLQRGYDQLVHDIALQNLDVTFGIDRAGLVGEDGPTHAGVFDYAFMRTLPNLVLMAPKDENECRQMLYTAYQFKGPAAVRYPRGIGPGSHVQTEFTLLPIGQSEQVYPESTLSSKTMVSPEAVLHKLALLAFGSMVGPAVAAAKTLQQRAGLQCIVINMRFIKPLDTTRLTALVREHYQLVTLEEHAVMGGAGSAVNEALYQLGLMARVLNLGLPDSFLTHATHGEMLDDAGLGADGIVQKISHWLGKIEA